MDGEASNIPMVWIRSVFDGIQFRKGDVKLSSVSVLGIQSSGKSTLLNSMFGLQFNVSAGRCTRGVYTQLIPIREQDSSDPAYLMVIDTEGLRAPELSGCNINHDNELATFVIGLGDFALINIKGETISDMKDVLEIVVHGLLRLRQAMERNNPQGNGKDGKIRLKQSCTFIHQNVSAKEAKDKMLQGHENTLKILDDVTRDIAEKEGIPDVNAFKDVFSFDPLSSIKYVPDLWHGSPPMAPTSTKYSNKVMEIVNHVKDQMKENSNMCKISDSFCRLEDLWEGILKEDFVFSFRNSLEIKAYNAIDLEFKKLKWEMQKAQQKWIDSNVKKSIDTSTSKSNLLDTVQRLKTTFLNFLNDNTAEMKTKLSAFVRTPYLKDQMMHWEEYVLKRVDVWRTDLEMNYEMRVQEMKNAYIVNLSERTIFEEKDEEISMKARNLANTLKKKKLTDLEIKNAFDEMFESWIQEIEKENPSLSNTAKQKIDKEVHDNILETLKSRYHSYSPQLHSSLTRIPIASKEKFRSAESNYQDMVQREQENRSIFQNFFSFFKSKERHHSHIIKALQKTDKAVHETTRKEHCIGKAEFEDILKTALDSLYSNCNERKSDFSISIAVQVDFVLLVSRRCYHSFVQHNEAIMKNNSLRNRLAMEKTRRFVEFKGIVAERHSELIAADVVICALKEQMRDSLLTQLSDDLENQVLNRYNFSKLILMKDTLLYLSSRSSFENFMNFVTDPLDAVLKFIILSTVEFFFKIPKDRSSLKARFEIWAERKIDEKIASVYDICNDANHNDIEAFKQALSNKEVNLTREWVSRLNNYAIKKFSQFKQTITHQLSELKTELLEYVAQYGSKWGTVNVDEIHKSKLDISPFTKALTTLWGCKEKCPWCAEPCIQETEHESKVKHRCIQHRPGGVHGIYWKTNSKLCIENCNFEIGTENKMKCGRWCKCEIDKCNIWHPTRDYSLYMPEWDIECQPDMERSKFWNWFVCKYSKELADFHNRIEADIPSSWKFITDDDAFHSLNKSYGKTEK